VEAALKAAPLRLEMRLEVTDLLDLDGEFLDNRLSLDSVSITCGNCSKPTLLLGLLSGVKLLRSTIVLVEIGSVPAIIMLLVPLCAWMETEVPSVCVGVVIPSLQLSINNVR
jgi:hypothetical protein